MGEYFGITIETLKKGVYDYNYTDIETAEFNQPLWQGFLKQHDYDEREAIKAYLDFEREMKEETMAEHAAMFQNSGPNYGLIGNAHAPVIIINGAERTLSGQEAELLRLFAGLSIIEQSKVLIYTAELYDKRAES